MQAVMLSVLLVFCIIHFVSVLEGVKDVGNVEDKAPKDESLLSEDENTSKHIGDEANKFVPHNDESPANTIVPKYSSIRNKLSDFREVIRQRTAATAEHLRDMKPTLHQNVYNAAGDLYEMGSSLRRAFANKMQAQQQRLEKSLEIWNKIELKGKTQEEKIEMLIDVISEEMVKQLPPYTKIRPIEVISTTKYICGAKGMIKDLRSIEKVGMTIEPIDGDGFTAEIDYKFNNLHFNYSEFYIKALRTMKRKGYLDIDFKDNNLKVKMKISNFVQIIPKLVKKDCIVSVLDAAVTQLNFAHSSLSGPRNDKTRKLLSGKINDYLHENQEKLRAGFEQRVLVVMHKALTTGDAWICKDEVFAELIKSKGGKTDGFEASNKFKKKCGQDFYIKPYKTP